jgi:hypothetical protein
MGKADQRAVRGFCQLFYQAGFAALGADSGPATFDSPLRPAIIANAVARRGGAATDFATICHLII